MQTNIEALKEWLETKFEHIEKRLDRIESSISLKRERRHE